MEYQLAVGDQVTGTVTERLPAGEWFVTSERLPTIWKGVLKSRHRRPYSPGDEGTFWVLSISVQRRVAILTDSDFGRLPISDRMRPRYLRGLRSVVDLLRGDASWNELSPDAFSEVKGMFNRCYRKDQPDWYSVFLVLGRPSMPECRTVADNLSAIARSMRNGDAADVSAELDELRQLRVDHIAAYGIAKIEQAARGSHESSVTTGDGLENPVQTVEC